MTTLMMKLGGSSVGTTAALTQVLTIVLHEHKRWDRLVLIASALDGVTDMLLEAAHLAQMNNPRGYRRITATLRTRHLALVEHLPLSANARSALQADIDQLLFEVLDVCQTIANTPSDTLSPAASDKIAAVGERLAARIIAALLRQNDLRGVAIDGTDIVITDQLHGNATPDMGLTRAKVNETLLPLLERQIIPVVTGFIGATPTGQTTTIGRGGSDYTASILSLCLGADELWIWSDVDGMMSTDPREVSEARVIEEMTYNEVAELAHFGARILHSRMIQPLKERAIPLRVKNVFKPQLPGTLIHPIEAAAAPNRIKAVTMTQAIGLTTERSGSLAAITALVDDTLFAAIGATPDVMISSQASARSFLCFIVPTTVGADAVHTGEIALRNRLVDYRDPLLWQVRLLAVVTAIGEQLDNLPSWLPQVLSQLQGIAVLGIAQGPSRCSLSIMVEPDDAELALRRIHALAIKSA